MTADEVAGLDYSLARPDPHAISGAGYGFVVRYLSPLIGGDPNRKDVSGAEVVSLRAAGLPLAVVWETTADRARGGTVAGAADGLAARARAIAVGYPPGAVIFWAVDWAATPADLPAVQAYGEAFGVALGPLWPHGPYGSAAVVDGIGGAFPFRWQTGAWSGDVLSPLAHLYQRRAPSGHWPVIPGTDEDVVCAPVPMAGPSGGVVWVAPPAWAATHPAPTPPPAPQPAPVPLAPPTPPPVPPAGFRAAYGDTSPGVADLQRFLARYAPSYAGRLPATGRYLDETTAAVAEFARRSGIPGADGRNVGPLIAAALARAGFRG